MMIIFGTRGKTIAKTVQMEGVSCPHCQTQGVLSQGGLRYFHIYWIPMFIVKKTVFLVCPHCKFSTDNRELPKEIVKELKGQVFTKSGTWGYNFGLILFLGLMGFTFSTSIYAVVMALLEK